MHHFSLLALIMTTCLTPIYAVTMKDIPNGFHIASSVPGGSLLYQLNQAGDHIVKIALKNQLDKPLTVNYEVSSGETKTHQTGRNRSRRGEAEKEGVGSITAKPRSCEVEDVNIACSVNIPVFRIIE